LSALGLSPAKAGKWPNDKKTSGVIKEKNIKPLKDMIFIIAFAV